MAPNGPGCSLTDIDGFLQESGDRLITLISGSALVNQSYFIDSTVAVTADSTVRVYDYRLKAQDTTGNQSPAYSSAVTVRVFSKIYPYGPPVTGRLYLADGSPAAGVRVWLYPVDFIPLLGNPTDSAVTDYTGKYRFDAVITDTFNIQANDGYNMAFIDSVVVGGFAVAVPADTVKPPGSITGRVQLQNGDDPRKVTIMIRGTNHWSVPDSLGNFRLLNLPEGEYLVRFLFSIDEYAVLDTNITVKSGLANTLPNVIRLPFIGLPTPSGLSTIYDSTGLTVTVKWNAPTYGRQIVGYNVFRRQSAVAVWVQIGGLVVDTVYQDSTVQKNQSYEYTVTAVDSNGNEGPRSTSVIQVTMRFNPEPGKINRAELAWRGSWKLLKG